MHVRKIPLLAFGIAIVSSAACGSPSAEQVGSQSSALGSDVCATAAENSTAAVTCPAGQVIAQVVFASYGTPAGACGGFAGDATCNADVSSSVVESACLGQNSCAVDANNGVFDDPCPGVTKSLSIEVHCTGTAAPPATTPPSTPPATPPSTPPTPPPATSGNVYLGAYPGNGPCTYPNIEQCVSWYEGRVGKKTAIVHAFSGFEQGWDDWFSRVIAADHTMMISINPQGSIPDILNGVYDADLRRWGKQIADNGKGPVFVRYMHEMNLPDNPAGWMATHYGAASYIAAFRRVHDQLLAGGGTNIKHVWAPNVFWGEANASNPIWFKPYYPGDAYVDWVGLDGYPMSPGDTFDAQFGPSVALLESMTSRPIMIAEYGVVEMNPVGVWKANWFNDFFNVLPTHPQIQAIFYQDGTDGGTDHRLETSAGALTAFKAGISAARYSSSYP